jgi:hypothetical protein
MIELAPEETARGYPIHLPDRVGWYRGNLAVA